MKTIFVSLLVIFGVSASAQNPTIKPGVVTKITITPEKWNQLNDDYLQLQNEMKELQVQQAKIQAMLQEMQSYDQKMKSFSLKLKNWEKEIDAAGNVKKGELFNATKQMQETQMSFNLQYLQLQNQMQTENRRFTAISNIMKTKHDTVKNSISNIK